VIREDYQTRFAVVGVDLGPSAPPELVVDVAVARGLILPPTNPDEREELLTLAELALQACLVRKFGPAAGVLLHRFIIWTHEEAPPSGWLSKMRWELQEETGLCERGVREALSVLSGGSAVPGKKRTPRVVDERWCAPGKPNRYTVYFKRLAKVLDEEA
jgi:hypothetical protein